MTLLQRIRTAGNRVRPASGDVVPPVVTDPYEPVAPETFTVPYSLPSGSTITVGSDGGDDYDTTQLQTAINAASAGDVIVLRAGDTFTGNFTLPNKGTDSDWIYIISSALASLPAEGTRVALADVTNMPKIQSTTSAPAIASLHSANHYRFAGIEFDKPSTNGVALILLGYNGSTDSGGRASTVSELPYNIVFDRCVIRTSSDSLLLRRGILLNGRYNAVVDCHIENVKDTTEAQGIHISFGEGPYLIHNNFIEAAGENLMTGGEGVPIENDVPADITFTNNYCYKDPAWEALGTWEVKNLFELKRAQRVLVEGNVFENNWVDGQNGTAILFTVRNQSNDAPWSIVQDVTFRNNLVRNSPTGFLLNGEDNVYPSQQTKRIVIDNNLLDELTSEILVVTTPDAALLYLTVTNNTMLHDPSVIGNKALDFDRSGGGAAVDGLVFQNNILTHGNYQSIFTTDTANYTFADNGWILNDSSGQHAVNVSQFATRYPDDLKADDIDDVDFTDYATGNYLLVNTSPFYQAGSDSADMGVGWAEHQASISGVVP